MGFFDFIKKIPVVGTVAKGIGNLFKKDNIGDTLGAVSNIGGALIGAQSAKDINQRNIQQAGDLRSWQLELANSAHQREVEDLRKAGLNPILSAKYGGAPVPSGAMASLLNPHEGFGGTVSSAFQNYMTKKLNRQYLMTEKTKQDYNSAITAKVREEAKQEGEKTKVLKATSKSRKGTYWTIRTIIKDLINTVNPFDGLLKTKQ